MLQDLPKRSVRFRQVSGLDSQPTVLPASDPALAKPRQAGAPREGRGTHVVLAWAVLVLVFFLPDEGEFMLGVTFGFGIVDGDARQLIFGSAEFQRRTFHARR